MRGTPVNSLGLLKHTKRKKTNNVKALFCPMSPDITNNTALFEESQATPACPSGKSSIKMKMGTQHSVEWF
jgi:hypothetical protein